MSHQTGIAVIVGLLLGLWMGVNIGRDQFVFANPFKEQTLQEKMKKASEAIIKESGDKLEEAGKALKDSLNEKK